eukprot:TRINITY_DN1717_c0_g1_i2.p1 TRINITY_DN1717_c0_g1~~TRINITY_DN1717_c0_g1_i2.p1  ORF type:complete len:240 (+),score=7.51 TRINITY_DN1717_c0_g1_i2:3-722(+)
MTSLLRLSRAALSCAFGRHAGSGVVVPSLGIACLTEVVYPKSFGCLSSRSYSSVYRTDDEDVEDDIDFDEDEARPTYGGRSMVEDLDDDDDGGDMDIDDEEQLSASQADPDVFDMLPELEELLDPAEDMADAYDEWVANLRAKSTKFSKAMRVHRKAAQERRKARIAANPDLAPKPVRSPLLPLTSVYGFDAVWPGILNELVPANHANFAQFEAYGRVLVRTRFVCAPDWICCAQQQLR